MIDPRRLVRPIMQHRASERAVDPHEGFSARTAENGLRGIEAGIGAAVGQRGSGAEQL